MAEPFKNMYNRQFFSLSTKDLKLVIDDSDAHGFVSQVMDDEWEGRELKQRRIYTTSILKKFLPVDYKEVIAKILELLDYVKSTRPDFSVVDDTKFELMLEYGVILNNYVEQHGLDDYEAFAKAIEKVTQFTSCELVTHPFVTKHPDKMMKQMLVWSKHERWGVRRLTSEGCRPRLPWTMALPNLKKDPTSIILILESLKSDPARFVRLSVANSLNDIAKDDPEIVIDLAKKWKGESKEVDWTIKHGCQTFLKQGIPEVTELFSSDSIRNNISAEDSQISSPKVKVGDSLEFGFNSLNRSNKTIEVRLEYDIHHQKTNGTLMKKVHKISEKEYTGNSTTRITRKYSSRVVTMRKFHLGFHQIAIIINGSEFEKYDFDLIE